MNSPRRRQKYGDRRRQDFIVRHLDATRKTSDKILVIPLTRIDQLIDVKTPWIEPGMRLIGNRRQPGAGLCHEAGID